MLKIKVNRDDFLRALSAVQSIVEKRSSMPILSNILLEAAEGEMVITATDLEIIFRGVWPVEIEEPGRITIPARKLYEIVSAIAHETITLDEAESFNLEIRGSRSHFQLHGLPPEDFPTMPDYQGAAFIPVEARVLAEMIAKTIHSVTADETRYNLSGVYAEVLEKDGARLLRFVSTDGHRLSMVDAALPRIEELNLEGGVLISKKAMSEMSKFALENAEGLSLGFTKSSVIMTAASSVLILRLLEGRFPDYTMVIPERVKTHMRASRSELLDMFKRIAVMSTEQYKGVKLILTPKQLTLSSVNPDFGEAEESMPVDYEGEDISIGFNVRYFIDVLSVMKSGIVSLTLKDAKYPCLVEGAEDKGFLGVIMPMKV